MAKWLTELADSIDWVAQLVAQCSIQCRMMRCSNLVIELMRLETGAEANGKAVR